MAYYFEHRSFRDIARFYNGYIALLPNSIAYLIARLPVILSPLAYTLTSLLIASIAFSAFSWRCFRTILPSDTVRLMICISLAAMPLGKAFLYTNLSYAIWNCLIILFWLILAEKNSYSFTVAATIASILIICSNPLSMIFLPLLIWTTAKRGKYDLFFSMALVITATLYFYFGIEKPEKTIRPLYAITQSFKYYPDRVIREVFLGGQLNAELFSGIKPHYKLLSGWGFFLASIIIASLSPINRRLKAFIVFCFLLSFTLMLAALMARGILSHTHLQLYHLQRYFYVSQFLWACGFLILVYTVMLQYFEQKSVVTTTACWGILSAVLCYNNPHLFAASKKVSTDLLNGLHKLQYEIEQKEAGNSYSPRIVIKRKSGWDLIFNI